MYRRSPVCYNMQDLELWCHNNGIGPLDEKPSCYPVICIVIPESFSKGFIEFITLKDFTYA